MILIAIPCYNEEKIIKKNILILLEFCDQNLKQDFTIIIADNNSNDQTKQIIKGLENEKIKYIFIPRKGKGLAIETAWQSQDSDIYVFMDADLAADLNALPELIRQIKQGYDICIGSRFHKLSKVKRGIIRKIFSHGYSFLFKIILNSKINDAPCGFKAINRKARQNILPQVRNKEWFFDSELLILAEKQNYKIKEIPIKWEEPKHRKSRAGITSIIREYLKMLLKTRKRLKNS